MDQLPLPIVSNTLLHLGWDVKRRDLPSGSVFQVVDYVPCEKCVD